MLTELGVWLFTASTAVARVPATAETGVPGSLYMFTGDQSGPRHFTYFSGPCRQWVQRAVQSVEIAFADRPFAGMPPPTAGTGNLACGKKFFPSAAQSSPSVFLAAPKALSAAPARRVRLR